MCKKEKKKEKYELYVLKYSDQPSVTRRWSSSSSSCCSGSGGVEVQLELLEAYTQEEYKLSMFISLLPSSPPTNKCDRRPRANQAAN